MRILPKRLKWVIIILIPLMVFSCAEEPIDNPVLTFEQEMELGEELSSRIKNQPGVYPILRNLGQSSVAYAHLRNLFQSLWQITDNRPDKKNTNNLRFDWEIYIIIDDSKENIITLPGGKLFIYTGFLKFINNEAELLAVLAHELYYTDRSYAPNPSNLSPITALVKSQLVSNGDGTARLLDIINNNDYELANQFLTYATSMPYEEITVRDADISCMEMICGFTWAPDGLVTLLNRIRSIGKIEWIITRPPSNINQLIGRGQMIQNLADECNSSTNSLFEERYKEMIIDNLP